jgi:SAM-dependent methyltransferase
LISLNKKSKKLLLLQRNELLTDKQKFLRKRFGRFIFTNFLINFYQDHEIENKVERLFESEFNSINEYLPQNVKNIIDVGCGLGIIDIFLNRFYKKNLNFYLLDKNKIDKKIKYGFSEDYESYNDLEETRNLLLNNDLNESSINIIDVDKKIEIKEKIDLVISLKSMGYHYPFENYLKLFSNCCTKQTTFIFDISVNQNHLLDDYFDEIQLIYEEKSIHPLKRLCCRKYKLF